jgi:hypothetical protein
MTNLSSTNSVHKVALVKKEIENFNILELWEKVSFQGQG